ncbi:MAG: precorrin-6Y methyltransferase [Coxiella sp. RIFCSPHIGHO2_12_FULL_44_14]|nr:MAG: precorrin-6Y methyltransferase [Coxiella sp. RIFCSPHIGHO2_12_FULL_44_14]
MPCIEKFPWLTILGWGEDGIDGLSKTSLALLQNAEIVFGAKRHIDLLPELDARIIEWPVPFSDGIDLLLSERSKKVVMLASGDPFWFGAGTVISKRLESSEWQAIPAPSTFNLAASLMGWGLERVKCLGLHAQSLLRIRRYLQPGNKILVLLRDGNSVSELQKLLIRFEFDESKLTILESLRGATENIRSLLAKETLPHDISQPVVAAIEVFGKGECLPLTPGIPDTFFFNDGQITKCNVRAVTLSALAPRPGEMLWDIGAGSGSISIEWLLRDERNNAIAFEQNPERVQRIKHNAMELGVDWLQVVEGDVLEQLYHHPKPDVVFIGGGLSLKLLNQLRKILRPGTRIVANAVTLESETILTEYSKNFGGELLRIEISVPKAIGSMRAWDVAYPIVQWRGVC